MHIIGIAGPSGAGKSYIAQSLLDADICTTTAIISLDHYYHDQSHLTPSERAALNFDHPCAVDHHYLIAQLTQLHQGQAIQRPCYDFATHSRRRESVPVFPVDLLILEGLFALYWPALRQLLTLSIFIEAPDTLCYHRRMTRDMQERGRSSASVKAQYTTTVQPMAMRYIMPTREYAAIVLSGDAPIASSITRIRMLLDAQLPTRSSEGLER